MESNLDEWFMIRVGGLSDLASLKNQPKDNKSNLTPGEQLDAIFEALPSLIERHEKGLAEVEAALAEKGLVRVSPADYTESDRAAVQRHFERRLAPIISPLIVDPRHPFPNLRNGRLFVACSLDGNEETGLLGIIEVPRTEQRVVALPSTSKAYRYTLLEDVLETCLDQCFGDYAPKRSAVLRVTRNADIDPDGEGVEEEEDYRQHMKKVLKLRQRLQPVRLEIRGKLNKKLEDLIADELSLEPRRIFRLSRPINLGYVYGLESHIPDHEHVACVYRPFEPQVSPMVDLTLPVREQVEDHDVLLTYPYESMTPLLRLVREASADDACISIKITLYRVAKSSHLCESLISAASPGPSASRTPAAPSSTAPRASSATPRSARSPTMTAPASAASPASAQETSTRRPRRSTPTSCTSPPTRASARTATRSSATSRSETFAAPTSISAWPRWASSPL